MPFVGSVDLSNILNNLGDPDHGLSDAGPASNTETQYEDHVYRATWGPVEMSTETALEGAWKPIWDVNGYYRALGVPWPYTARKKALRRLFQAANGHNSPYLTYVMKQLLDPEVRAEYDSMPFGTRYRDRYVIEMELQLLSKKAAELSEDEGIIVTRDELVEEIERERELRKLPDLKPLNSNWDWGYYLLRSRKTEYEELIDWQRFLIAAFAARGLVKVISIGYIGKTQEPFEVIEWQGKTIVFLNEEISPSLELAETVVSQIAPLTEGIPHDSTSNPSRRKPSSRAGRSRKGSTLEA